MATTTTWDDVLNNPQPSALRGGDSATGDPKEDGVLVASSKFASKCRACQGTIDIGDSAWFQRDGEPGRKTTCVACHQQKVAATGAVADPEKPADKPKKAIAKRPRPQTKLEPKMLADVSKGVVAVFREFRNIKFKGKKHEASDLRKLLSKYAEWAHSLLPAVEFTAFVEKLDKVGGNGDVRMRIAQLRDVQQGLLTLEEMQQADEYAQQPMDDFGEPLPVFAPGADDDDDWHVDGAVGGDARAGGSPAGEARAAVGLSAEQAERAARNRQAAIERAAALKAQREGAQAAAGPSGGAVGADQFLDGDDDYPEDEGGYPDDDEVAGFDEEMAAQMVGDIDIDVEDGMDDFGGGMHQPRGGEAVAGEATGTKMGPEVMRGTSVAAQAETQDVDTSQSQTGGEDLAAGAELSALEGVGSLGEMPGDDAAERRARALADAMAMDEDF